MFTLRAHCKTAVALAETARKIRAIGYTAFQLSGLGPIPDDEVVRIMQGEGLRICATHEPSPMILDEPEKGVERLQRSGCQGFIVEQDSTPGNPFDSIRQSFDYIKANLVSELE